MTTIPPLFHHNQLSSQDFSITDYIVKETYSPDSTSRNSCNAEKLNGKMTRMKRATFSRKQLELLEARFLQQSFISKEERKAFAEQLQLTEKQIMVWFQNRRGRLKRRGPTDSAYDPLKMEELRLRRPFPMMMGMMSYKHLPAGSDNSNIPWMYNRPANETLTVTARQNNQTENTVLGGPVFTPHGNNHTYSYAAQSRPEDSMSSCAYNQWPNGVNTCPPISSIQTVATYQSSVNFDSIESTPQANQLNDCKYGNNHGFYNPAQWGTTYSVEHSSPHNLM